MLTELKEKWLFLDPSPESYITDFGAKQIATTLRSMGGSPSVLRVYPNQTTIDPSWLLDQIKTLKPDRICWSGVIPWRYVNALKQVEIPKISLWFDDPCVRCEDARVVEAVQSAGPDFKLFIWDRYWMEKVKKDWGVDSKEIELAARPEEYYTTEIEMTDDCVFIGNLHSQVEIEKCASMLPKIFQRIFNDWRCAYFPSSQDQVILDVLKSWPLGDQNLFKEICERNINHLTNLRWCIWAHAKNQVRINMLREVLKVSPVRMFTETHQLIHAGLVELRHMIGEFSDRLKICDTSDYRSHEMGQLYHYGILHLQATDPQSVYGGIPYRNYQTAASGRPLFTDYKPDWNKSFEYGTELITYESWSIAKDLEIALRDKDKLREIGRNARKRFESSHTWNHRIERMIE